MEFETRKGVVEVEEASAGRLVPFVEVSFARKLGESQTEIRRWWFEARVFAVLVESDLAAHYNDIDTLRNSHLSHPAIACFKSQQYRRSLDTR